MYMYLDPMPNIPSSVSEFLRAFRREIHHDLVNTLKYKPHLGKTPVSRDFYVRTSFGDFLLSFILWAASSLMA